MQGFDFILIEAKRSRLLLICPTMAPKKKAKNESAKPAASNESAARQTPNWPAFNPLIPESDLSLNELLPGQIVTIPNFWTAKLCKDYVSFLSSLPLITTPGKPKKGDAVRVNDRFQIDDPSFAERLWSDTSLKNLILGNNENGHLGMDTAQRKRLWGGEVVITTYKSSASMAIVTQIGRPEPEYSHLSIFKGAVL